MIFYLCNGNQLAGTQADAKALDRNYVQVDVPTDKAGLMAYINQLMANAPDMSGVPDREETPSDLSKELNIFPIGITNDLKLHDEIASLQRELSEARSYTNKTGSLDEAFLAAPLGQQLTLASIALEEARTRIR